MSKYFFAQLGNQLCSMKNSPFIRIGQSGKLQLKQQKQKLENKSQLKNSLSFDGDRLFNPQKYKEREQYMEQSYVDMVRKREKQALFQIQFDLLKRNTNEEYAKEVQKMKQVRKFDHKQPYTWFGVYRGTCLLCGKCGEYQGCFSQSQRYSMTQSQFSQKSQYSQNIPQIPLLHCLKCNCPMNSHIPIHPTPPKIFPLLTPTTISDEHLNFPNIILAFKLPQSQICQYPTLIQLLKYLNCPVLGYKLETKLQFELKIIKANIVQNGNTQKYYMESLMGLIDGIAGESQWKWDEANRPVINQAYEDMYAVIRKIGSKISGQMQIGDRQCVIVFMCRYQIEHVKNLVRYLSGNDRVSRQTYHAERSASTEASSISSNRNSRISSYSSPDQQNQLQQFLQAHKIKFIFSTYQRKQSIILSQYFFKENYQMQYNIFLLPSGALAGGTGGTGQDGKEMEYNSARFQDVLDYNGYTVFMENLKEVDRGKLEMLMHKVLGYRTSKINYILGQQLLSPTIKKLCLKLTAKSGPPCLSLLPNTPQFISIPSTPKNEIPQLLQLLYPQFNHSQRCIFIIRPFVMNSNFQEVIVNLLRINKFILLKRVSIKLAEKEAEYLAMLEKIGDADIGDYVKYMTAGVCEIILTSKRAAIYEAYALAHGCLNGISEINTKTLKTMGQSRSITIQTRKNRQIFEQQLPIFTNTHITKQIHSPNPSSQIFKSIRQLIDIQKVLFGYTSAPQYTTNTRTGQITRLPTPPPVPQLPPKQKQSLLSSLKFSSFNPYIFTSLSPTLTQQLCSIFLPQCTLFQPITILLKPTLIHLAPLVRKCLLQHRYHIIIQKQLQLNRTNALQFVYNCQKIRLSNEEIKYIVDVYAKEKVHVFCLAKVAGRKEIMSMLSGFGFLHQGGWGDWAGGDDGLVDLLVPVWNNQELLLQMICQPLANLEETIHIICQHQSPNNDYNPSIIHKNSLSKVQKFTVLNYLVGSFYGVSIDDLQLSSKLGKFTIYIADQFLAPKLQSWYYATISNIKPNYVPLLFQYRQIGQTMVCIQSDKGMPFMDLIAKMYFQEQAKFKAAQIRQQSNFSLLPTVKKNKRRSLTLFLWGKKLTQLCLDLSKVTTQLKDFGQIVLKNGQYQGSNTLQQAQLDERNFLHKLEVQFQSMKEIKTNIRKLIDSRHQKQRYLAQNKRLLPSFSLSSTKQCLRVVQKTQTTKLHLMDKYSLIDPDNQNSKLKDLYSLHLFNILPQIRTKYSMIAEIYYFFIKMQLEGYEMPQSNPNNTNTNSNINSNEQEAHQLQQMVIEMQNIFIDLLTDVEDLEVIQYEIFLRFLVQFIRMPSENQSKGKFVSMLKYYPNLRKNKKIQRDDVAGKKRKFLQHKQYFKRNNQQNEQTRQIVQKKYLNFDLNSLNQQLKPTALYDPKDPLHYRFAHTENRVNLLRETKHDQQRNGIYVQFQKNISQKQQMLKQKIKQQAEKFTFQKDQILYQTGLQRELWYRKAKGQHQPTQFSKTNAAIQKQIEKLMSFKQLEKKKMGQTK